MKDLKTTNSLLLIIVIPIIFYLLKILSFIFIPLVASMFISLLFLPLLRWLKKRKVPKLVSVSIVISIIVAGLFLIGRLIRISSNEILMANSGFVEKAELKISSLIINIQNFLGIENLEIDKIISYAFHNDQTIGQLGTGIDMVSNTVSMSLMTLFFLVLLLSESFNFENLMNNTIFKIKYSSVKIFRNIEKDILRFVMVKFIISLFTGIGFTLACLFFDVSFPIFWGLFAFAINFVQMIGSVISVVLLSLFSLVELDPTGTLLFFILSITFVQVLMGGILEPIFMGKTFSINIITILVMLMFWGYIWGIPGLILSIPITVFMKIIFEYFPSTRLISNLMEGSDRKISIRIKK